MPSATLSASSSARGHEVPPARSGSRRAPRVVVTHHAARRYAERVLAPDDPRRGDLAWVKRHVAWLVHHSEYGGHLRRDPVVGPWLARVGRENQGRPLVPSYHWQQQVGFLLVDDRRDRSSVERVVLTCFHGGEIKSGERRVESVAAQKSA